MVVITSCWQSCQFVTLCLSVCVCVLAGTNTEAILSIFWVFMFLCVSGQILRKANGIFVTSTKIPLPQKSVYAPDTCEAYITAYKPVKLDSVNQSKP